MAFRLGGMVSQKLACVGTLISTHCTHVHTACIPQKPSYNLGGLQCSVLQSDGKDWSGFPPELPLLSRPVPFPKSVLTTCSEVPYEGQLSS